MALTSGPNLGILVNGAQGESHYAALMTQWRGLDALVMPRVKDKDLATPPGSPADGDCYIVASGATGAWSGHSGKIARYSTVAASWEFYTPKEGWQTAVEDENADYRYNGSGWDKWLGEPSTGWETPTGTLDRTTFDASTVTLSELAERVAALITDLKAQGRLKS